MAGGGQCVAPQIGVFFYFDGALGGGLVFQTGDVAARVYAGELDIGYFGGFCFLHQVPERGFAQCLFDCFNAFGAFGVSGAGEMRGAGGGGYPCRASFYIQQPQQPRAGETVLSEKQGDGEQQLGVFFQAA